MNNTKTKDSSKELLIRIGRYLMLHGSYTNNLGLLNGKMGISIFFFHYAKYAKRKHYERFAGELLDEIYHEIRTRTPIDFKDGLCGIAWGMEYLLQNNFVKGEADDVLEALDKRILEWDVRRVTDPTLETGLKGVAAYLISRSANIKNGLICKDYINDLQESLQKNDGKDKETEKLIQQLKTMVGGLRLPLDRKLLTEMVNKTVYSQKTLFNNKRSLGISNNGFSGVGLKIMGGV